MDVAFSSDGKLIGSASRDKTAKIWDARTGKLQRTLKLDEEVFSIAFAPDGKAVACGGENELTLWDVRTGKLLWRVDVDGLPKHDASGRPKGGARSLAFAPDSGVLATADGSDQAVRLWDVRTGTLQRALRGAGGTVSFSPDGKLIVCGEKRDDGVSLTRKATLWDAQTGALRQTFAGAGPLVLFAPDGKTLGSAQEKSVSLCDARTGKVIRTFGAHRDRVSSITFSDNGKLLATGCSSEMKLWEVPSGALRRMWKGHEEWVYGLAFSPSGTRLVSASADRTVKVWDVWTGELVHSLTDPGAVLLP